MEEERKKKSKINQFLFAWVKDNYDKVFIGVLIVAFLIRLYLFFKTIDQPIWWDAGAYLAIAKKWAYASNISDVWYYRRGFLWPLFCMLFYKFGLGEAGIRFSLILFSTGIVATSYFLIKEMFNKKLALLTSLGLTFSWVILFFTVRPLTYIPGPFFLLLAVLFFWKGYEKNKGKYSMVLFGLFYGLAVFTRMQNLMFVPMFLIFAITKEKFAFLKNKKLWTSILVFLLVMTPMFFVYWQNYGNPLSDIATYYLGIGGSTASGETSSSTLSNVFNFIKDIPYELTGKNLSSLTGIFISPLLLLFILGVFYFLVEIILGYDLIFKNNEMRKKLFVLVFIFLFYLEMGYTSGHEVFQGYMIPALPFIFLLVSFSLVKIGSKMSEKFNVKKATMTILIFLILIILLIPNFIWGNNLIEVKKTSYIEIKEAGLWLKENSNPEDVIISTSFSQTAYYAERAVYPFDSKGEKADDRVPRNESEFHEWVLENHPRYLVLSLVQPSKEWAYNYPVKHGDIWKPSKVWYSDRTQESAVLVIYESNF